MNEHAHPKDRALCLTCERRIHEHFGPHLWCPGGRGKFTRPLGVGEVAPFIDALRGVLGLDPIEATMGKRGRRPGARANP